MLNIDVWKSVDEVNDNELSASLENVSGQLLRKYNSL